MRREPLGNTGFPISDQHVVRMEARRARCA
jgi:hypothetical protein